MFINKYANDEDLRNTYVPFPKKEEDAIKSMVPCGEERSYTDAYTILITHCTALLKG
jgi:hypothetical protein